MSEANNDSVTNIQYDAVTGRYTASVPADTPASTAVIETLASIQGCRPTDLEPLYRRVDTDALNSLVESAENSSLQVHFTVHEHSVTVYADGTVELEPK